MNAQNSDDIWTDNPSTSPPPSPTASFASTSSSSALSFRPPQFDPFTSLSAQQKNLLRICHLHRHYEIEVMNTVVYLDIAIRRERDEPGVKFLRQELQEMREELARHREGRRRVEGKIKEEEERLRRVIVVVGKRKGEEKEKDVVARRQLEEMRAAMEKRKQKIICLR